MSRFSRGDTIIEVLVAITVFSLLAVGAIAIMNQGTATAQKALEITLVRQQIDAQAEAIRYIHDTYVDAIQASDTSSSQAIADWKKMTTLVTGDAVVPAAVPMFGLAGDGTCPTIPDRAFILNTHTGVLVDAAAQKPRSSSDPDSTPYAQAVYDGSDLTATYGLWVEAVRKTNAEKFVDFHIRACWNAPGGGVPTTLGTIVRLYAPTE